MKKKRFQYRFFIIFTINGKSKTVEAKVQATGSPRHNAQNEPSEAAEFIVPPFINIGKNVHVSMRAKSSAIPAPSTKADLQMPCTALLTTIKNPSMQYNAKSIITYSLPNVIDCADILSLLINMY